MHSPGFVRAEHPELGPLVYTPGELLPSWVIDAIDAGAQLVVGDEPGVLVLKQPPKRKAAS